MSDHVNLDRINGRPVPKAEGDPTLAGDIFDKAFSSFTLARADEARAAGIYPYFKPIAKQNGATVTVDGREMVIFGSNDYLGLTEDPRLKEVARAALKDFGTSCTGSRFLTGTLTLHEELEHRLSGFLGAEAVLTFSTGLLGALSVLAALAGRQDILYFDRENHASLYDGARLSFGSLRKYRHNDLEDLERLLERDAGKPGGRMIVTDGVFSMSGHVADLPGIVELARRYGARVAVDDAHATGVLGEGGRGTPEHFGLEDEIDLVIGTFSKSFASVGGFVSGPKEVISYVKHHARPFIFTAALPAMQVAAVLKALEIMEMEPHHREKLWQNVALLKRGMNSLGFDTLGSESQIVPVLIGPDELAALFWRMLWEEGIFTTPAVPPSVPPGRSIIRTSVNANHTSEQIERLLKAFAGIGQHLGVIG
ncbi:MAG: pyridoxal phosphate-dependent aminotransferase family protein [Actinomycetota bacterium]|nr:pyridoxal phosphate-dependent aminotransferase family protein [Actinomycetota bacterium]MDQ3926614.1 pyridoxal phosphate-dependent aminotransferase family protein [Actinomycetota bacterium]